MIGLIYTLVDPRAPHQVRYVGQTRQPARTRWYAHVNQAPKKSSWSSRWILKLLRSGVEPLMSTIVEVETDRLSDVERAWIAHYRSTGHRLTNITDGGEGHTGTMRPEHVAKVAAWHRGRKRPPETGRRISAAKKGCTYAKGRTVRPELRSGLSAAAKKRWSDPEYRRKNIAGLAKRAKHPKKLNWAAVHDIRRRHSAGEGIRPLSREFNVTPPAIRAIVRHLVWKEEQAAA